VGPRVVQLVFYIACAVYLYRTILLFHEKETALLGVIIYLFLPVSFAYAHLGELASGTVFFIVIISFYFIRFIKQDNDRDLLLVTYLIGIGFMYKRPILLMFGVCSVFLVAHKIKNRNDQLLMNLKIIMLSLVNIIPFMILSKYYSWRNYSFQLSNFTSFESKIFTYFALIGENTSWVVMILFMASSVYILLKKRSTVTAYFGSLFLVYYLFTASDMAALSPRLSLTFYPAITVYLSIFIFEIIRSFKWRYAYYLLSVLLSVYLIAISTVPQLNNRYLGIMNMKLHYFPSEQAMRWVNDNTVPGEKVLTIRILTSKFYRYKYAIEKNRFVDLNYEVREINTSEKLLLFCRKNNISYVMFPYSPAYIRNDIRMRILKYLMSNPNKEFIEVARFNRDENFIYLYKVKV
jgi:4-amino-4-deoxy-L-arabinose transferase-like glycosyltransferase